MLRTATRFGVRLALLVAGALALAAAPGLAADVTLVGITLSDNGDNDGFADGNETVDLRLTLRNDVQETLRGVQAMLTTEDPKIKRMLTPKLHVGDLAPGQTLRLPGSFRFKVADVQRGSAHEDFSAAFTLTLTALGPRRVDLARDTIVLPLDLDATEAGAPGTFFEGFEDGTYGAMAPMNIDAGKFSAEASEGYRCQYADPDWMWSNTYRSGLECWLGSTAESHGDEFFWNVVDGESRTVQGRSFSGHHAVWMGVLVEADSTREPGGGGGGSAKALIAEGTRFGYMTTPMGVLEGLVTGGPIHLAAGKVCEITRTTTCLDDGDCPEGELCLDAMPELAFKHQISLFRMPYPDGSTRSWDGAVVQAQVVDGDGSPLGVWTTLEPYTNGYDLQRVDNFVACAMDPIDDGNTEDDFYDPAEQFPRLGPSSLCYDQWGFNYLGDTDARFAAGNVGHAEGPGLEGETGPGTWVESRFDLSAFRGQSIRIRFIVSTLGDEIHENYEEMMEFNPSSADDGWWVDDITVTDTVDAPALLSVDEKDNSALAARERPQPLRARLAP